MVSNLKIYHNNLGTDYNCSGNRKEVGVKRWVVEVDESMVYVSILETLKVLLRNETIISEVYILTYLMNF